MRRWNERRMSHHMSPFDQHQPAVKPLTVLIVAYLFPPLAGGGIPRVQKLVKYLNRMGVHTIVLTVEPPPGMVEDPTLLNDIPAHTPISRVPLPRWMNAFLGLWRRRSESEKGKQDGTHSVDAKLHETAQEHGQARSLNMKQGQTDQRNTVFRKGPQKLKQSVQKLVAHALNWLRARIFVPDDEVVWVRGAVRAGMRVIERYPVDLIFSSSGPLSNHLVARALKRKTHLPWVADFRDPWTENMHRTSIRWRLALEKRMEKSVFEEADAITTVTESFAQDFKRLYPARDVHVIYNGFDPEDFMELKGSPPNAPLTFAYTGILYGKRHPRYFFQALKRLIDNGMIRPDDVRLEVAGVLDYPGRSENRDALIALGLETVVRDHGFLPHREALALLKTSHVLIVFGDQEATAGRYIPGKLFEYMAIGRPILGLLKPGEASRIIEQFALGVHADPSDVDEIEEALRHIVTLYRSGALLKDVAHCSSKDRFSADERLSADERFTSEACLALEDRLRRFRRDVQAEAFYALFQSVVGAKRR